jgi:hypothetical protein
VDPLEGSRRPETGAVRSNRPSERTLQTLRLLDLDGLLEQAPAAVFRATDTLYAETGDGAALAAAAEIALLVARETRERDPRKAAGWYLLAASRAYEALLAAVESRSERLFDPQLDEMRILYGRAVGAYVVGLRETPGGFSDHLRNTPWGSFEVEVERGPGLWNPEDFDELLPVEGLEIRGLRNHYEVYGLGAPLVAVRESRDPGPKARFYPPEGRIRSATAVLDFAASPRGEPAARRRSVRLALVDPLRQPRIRVRGRTVPVAADFTTPFAYLLSRADLKPGLLKPEEAQEHAGLFLLERYDPRRIPVVMVHGLWSTPLAWMELTNDLLGDEELRGAYQIWHFVYPTSLPYLYAGGLLRESLEDVRRTFDPEGDDPAMASMVVVAHSMGGLLARTLVTDSGMELWDTMFNCPPEELKAAPRDLAALRRTLIFEPEPWIRRVIFIAVPHGGSAMADSLLGRLSIGLARLPQEVAGLFQRVRADNPEAVRPAMAKSLQGGGPVSIRTLSPRHPLLQALARLPIAPGVPYHSILGHRGPVGGPPTTDGVVDYWSSHLPGAVSERIVPAGHAAYAHPVTIREIARILRLHLAEARSGGPSEGVGVKNPRRDESAAERAP